MIAPDHAREKRRELGVALLLTFVIAPAAAIGIVAAYGFCVWMFQLIAGPPQL